MARARRAPLGVRRSLRAEHGFPRDPKRRFGIEAVFLPSDWRAGADVAAI